jgi:hypothetical protein
MEDLGFSGIVHSSFLSIIGQGSEVIPLADYSIIYGIVIVTYTKLILSNLPRMRQNAPELLKLMQSTVDLV